MSDFVSKLQLAEKAREDIYFEKVNRALIEALHRQAEQEATAPGTATSSTPAAEDKHG
jgi:hypothetical protein